MVWYERYSMEIVYPLKCVFAYDYDDDDVINEVELVLDAYGFLKGVNVRGRFVPISSHF